MNLGAWRWVLFEGFEQLWIWLGVLKYISGSWKRSGCVWEPRGLGVFGPDQARASDSRERPYSEFFVTDYT